MYDPRLASPLREIWGTPQSDAAFADLERSADAGQHVDLFKLYPELDTLRCDLRFADLLRRTGLPE